MAHAQAFSIHFNTSLFAQLAQKRETHGAAYAATSGVPPPACAVISVMSPPEKCASTCPPVHADFGAFPSLILISTPSPLTRQPV